MRSLKKEVIWGSLVAGAAEISLTLVPMRK
jgi:hypothetical protein